MDRYTYINEKGEVLFRTCDLPDGEGLTIIQLAKTGRDKALVRIAERLAAYEATELTPEKISEIDRMYAEKCKELSDYQKAERSRGINGYAIIS